MNEFYFVQLTALNKENCESFISKSENSRSLDLSPRLDPGVSTLPIHAVNYFEDEDDINFVTSIMLAECF